MHRAEGNPKKPLSRLLHLVAHSQANCIPVYTHEVPASTSANYQRQVRKRVRYSMSRGIEIKIQVEITKCKEWGCARPTKSLWVLHTKSPPGVTITMLVFRHLFPQNQKVLPRDPPLPLDAPRLC